MPSNVVTIRFSGFSDLAVINERPMHDEARNAVVGCYRQLIVDLQPILDRCDDRDTFLWAMNHTYAELLRDSAAGEEYLDHLQTLLEMQFEHHQRPEARAVSKQIYSMFWKPQYADCLNVTLLWTMAAAINGVYRQLEIPREAMDNLLQFMPRALSQPQPFPEALF